MNPIRAYFEDLAARWDTLQAPDRPRQAQQASGGIP